MLLNLLPNKMPMLNFWPGFNKSFLMCRYIDALLTRDRLGIKEKCYVVSYTGNVHASNLEEVKSLYIALALVNRAGICAKLVRTGVDFVPMFSESEKSSILENVISLGIVDELEVPFIINVADVLVQPGLSNDWNKYRVPSKLPEFFASGKPVLLPRVNLGEAITHGINGLVVNMANAENIAKCLIEWLPLKRERMKVGLGGRMFARNHLSWQQTGTRLDAFFSQLTLPKL